MGNIESVDGQSELKHHIMPLKVPMPDPMELEERFALVLVSCNNKSLIILLVEGDAVMKICPFNETLKSN